ncbi:transposase domain-containing protein [Streptomyces beigongshangae]|uniref:transposase domain-containing protein n=1 Tax=Streptomyces beigongshangae TaxID=2841597 RepID=UPI001C84CE1F|nr:transposase domain-containing protein [Streptomyces sp. REN17]
MPRHCVLPSALTAITRTVIVAAGRFAPEHLGELTAVVPFELVDTVLAETRTVQQRLRDLPSRVGIYFLLAMCLFPEVGYRLVWDKLTTGLSGMPMVCPSAKALRDLRRRIDSAPVRALFEVLAGLLARPTTPGVRFGPYRTMSFDGCSLLRVPDSERNRAWLGRTSRHGYPTLELMTLIETGTWALVGAVGVLEFRTVPEEPVQAVGDVKAAAVRGGAPIFLVKRRAPWSVRNHLPWTSTWGWEEASGGCRRLREACDARKTACSTGLPFPHDDYAPPETGYCRQLRCRDRPEGPPRPGASGGSGGEVPR